MVGILKKGVRDTPCFRRSRSANSVNISDDVHIIEVSTGSDSETSEEPTTFYERVPLQTNAVKAAGEEEAAPSVEVEAVPSVEVEPAQQLSENGPAVQPALQRSFLETGPDPGSVPGTSAQNAPEEDGLLPNMACSFPSLPDTVLETMNLLVNGIVERAALTEEDIENRFISLSLAFKTDQLTLATRLELQQRQRDQAECNMSAEVARLKTAIHKLNHVYVDSESVENLTEIQTLVDILQQATDRVSSSAELFGAVQQEHRLSLTTGVLMTHVENMKRSFEKLNLELEEVKRVLSENNIVMEELPDLADEPAPRTQRYRSLAGIVTTTKKVGSKRRASIAAMSRPLSTSPDTLRSPLSPAASSIEPRSRMANVVNAIRRRTSLSTIVSPGADTHELSEQVPDTMEEIEEVAEVRPETLSDEMVATKEETTSAHDGNSVMTLPEGEDVVPDTELPIPGSTPAEETPAVVRGELMPTPSQQILIDMRRAGCRTRSLIISTYRNHRHTIFDQLRFYVAVFLVGLAAWLLVWVMLPSVEGCYRLSPRKCCWEEILRHYLNKHNRGPPPL